MTKILVIDETSVVELQIDTKPNGYASSVVGGFPRFYGCWSNDKDGVYLLGPSSPGKDACKINPKFLKTLLPHREEGYEDVYGPLVVTKLLL